MITHNQLLERVLDGRLILVGEYRGGKLDYKDIVDSASGQKIQTVQYVYAVECGAAFGTVRIFRPQPIPTAEVTVTTIGLEKGRRYAFELDRLVHKGGFVTAHLGYREPELVEEHA